MTNHNVAELNIERLDKLAFELLQEQTVSAVVLALGSNHNADYHLSQVRSSLAELGEIQLSTAFENPDFTATLQQPKPAYTNQGVYLALKENMTLGQLQQMFRHLEEQCGRLRSVKTEANTEQTSFTPVSMDIDTLLVALDKKNSLSNNNNSWTIVTDRYPFKEHEMMAVIELANELPITLEVGVR